MTDILAAWLPILYAGVGSCGVAYTLQIVAQADAEPTTASLIMARKAKHTSAETRESIIESFIDIYEEKGIDKTTVSAIVNRAHITRSTFYCYFRDVNELLEIAEREFFDNYIKVILPMVIRAVVAGDTTAIVPEISGLFKDHRRYVLLFLVTRPSPELTAQVKAFGRS